jgi:hypothetical protein
MAAQPKLNTAIGMDTVIDARVTGQPAAFHLAVGRIDDRIDFQGGDVPFPDDKPGIGMYCWEATGINYTAFGYQLR